MNKYFIIHINLNPILLYYPMKSLHRDCLIYITSFLCYIDIFSFRLSCKYIHSIIKLPDFTELIIKKLENHIPDARKLLNLFNDDENCVISGSFILHILYNSDWLPNDIDIYSRINSWNSKWNELNFVKHLPEFGFHIKETATYESAGKKYHMMKFII